MAEEYDDYISLTPRNSNMSGPQRSASGPAATRTASIGLAGVIVAVVALLLAITAIIVALWKWNYWSAVASASAIQTSQNVIVDGWVNTLVAYMIQSWSVVRLLTIPLLPAPDLATVYGNLGVTSNLQEADLYLLKRVSDTTTQPNNLFIDDYIEQADSTDGLTSLNFVTMNAYLFISDALHKTNITVINGTDALEVVRAINASTFIWSGDADGNVQFGFIAQNVNDSFPEAVRPVGSSGGGSYNETVGISVVALLSQLWAAVQQLDKQVNP